MRKALALAVLTGVALTLPAAADAAVFRGVLVAKDPNRQAIVVASPNGQARTVYVGNALSRLAVGRRMVVTGQQLASGAYVGRNIRVLGRARHARLRAVVVRAQGRKQYLVSAGGSTFSLRTASARARRTGSGSSPLSPGMGILADVNPTAPGGPAAGTVTATNPAQTIPLSGIFLGVSGNMLDLAVVGSGLVKLTVPTGFVLPALTPGKLVKATATPGPAGELILTGLQEDNQTPSQGSINITITIVNNNTNNNNNNSGGDDDDDDSDDSSSS